MKVTSVSEIKEFNIKKLYSANDYGGIDSYDVMEDCLYHNGDVFDFAESIDEILTTYYYPFFSTRKEALNE